MFLDDTACNLASLNLVRFLDEDGSFDIELFRHAVRLWTMVLEISVLMASFPSRRIAELSYRYRTLGLGYANIGSLLMRLGIPYDSDEGRSICGAITAIMTGEAYATSAEMAAELGPFPGFDDNREHMLRVIRNHRRAAYDAPAEMYEGLTHQTRRPVGGDHTARSARGRPRRLGPRRRARNGARLPQRPGDGARPDRHHRAGDGLRHHRHRARFRSGEVQETGRRRLLQDHQPGHPRRPHHVSVTPTEQIDEIVAYTIGHGTLEGCPTIDHEALHAKGFTDEVIARVEKALPTSFDIGNAFAPHVVGEDFLRGLGFTDEEMAELEFRRAGRARLHGLGRSRRPTPGPAAP